MLLFFFRVDVFRLTVLMQFKSFFYLLFQLFSCIPWLVVTLLMPINIFHCRFMFWQFHRFTFCNCSGAYCHIKLSQWKVQLNSIL